MTHTKQLQNAKLNSSYQEISWQERVLYTEFQKYPLQIMALGVIMLNLWT